MSNEETKKLELDEDKKAALDKELKKSSSTQASSSTSNNPPYKMTKSELINKLRTEVTKEEWFWRLCYMLSTKEHIRDKMADFENGEIYFNGLCAQMRNCKHEDAYRMLADNIVTSTFKTNSTYGDFYRYFYDLNFRASGYLKSRCSFCSDKIPGCIYRINGFIHFVCKSSNIATEEVYKELQGKLYEKQVAYARPLNMPEIDKENISFLDLLSVFAAIVMIKQRWISYDGGMFNIEYEYVDLLAHKKTSNIQDIIDIYDGNGHKVKVPKKDFVDHVQEKVLGIGVQYKQYPHRVAAYIMYLADKYKKNPVNVGLYIVSKLIAGRLGIYDSFKVELYRQRLRSLPMNNDDINLAEKMFNFVINHFFNKGMPYMPMNMVLYSDDEQETKELIDIFKWITWFYYYFNNRYVPVFYEEVSLADYSIPNIVKMIDLVRIPDKGEKLDKSFIEGPLFLHIKDFELLPELENKPGDNIVKMTMLQNAIERQQDKVVVVISGEKDKLKGVLEGYTEFYSMTVDKHLTLGNMSVNQIVFEIISKLEVSFELEEGFEKALKEYVYTEYKKSKLKSKSFIDKAIKDITFNHYDENFNSTLIKIGDIPVVEGSKRDKDIWEDVNALEGLTNVKEEFHKLQNLLMFRRKTMGRGISLADRPNLHMVFEGNPGTGKTTVARLLGDLLFNFGYLKQNKVIEVSPKDLIAQWVGQTAPKTASVCQSAYGGILFIDEAYELAVNGGGSSNDAFRSECVTELIKQMEDHRDNLVVIFAGYSKPMKDLLATNSGLQSRIGTIFTFEDFTEEQLLRIYKKLVKQSGMTMTPEAEATVISRIAIAREEEDFGNARFIRNLYEKTITQHAFNTIDSDDNEVLATITDMDIPNSEESKKANKKYHIGFV